MSRSLLRSVLELRTPVTRLPPSFLLPTLQQQSSRFFSGSSTRPQDVNQPPSNPTPKAQPEQPTSTSSSTTSTRNTNTNTNNNPYPREPQTTPPALSPESAQSLGQLLPLLRAQPAHYIRAHIWGRPYLVQAGDAIRLPFRMAGVAPGDVLRLDRASALGSRDYTLRGAPYVDERLFECRAVVLGEDPEPLREKVKTKRRQRRAHIVKSKHRYTLLRISDLVVKGPEAVGL
jgi:large subunit ribosomal protein L21